MNQLLSLAHDSNTSFLTLFTLFKAMSSAESLGVLKVKLKLSSTEQYLHFRIVCHYSPCPHSSPPSTTYLTSLFAHSSFTCSWSNHGSSPFDSDSTKTTYQFLNLTFLNSNIQMMIYASLNHSHTLKYLYYKSQLKHQMMATTCKHLPQRTHQGHNLYSFP